jgi:hypothetical protein
MEALKTARASLSKDASDLTQAVKKEILHLQQSLTTTPQQQQTLTTAATSATITTIATSASIIRSNIPAPIPNNPISRLQTVHRILVKELVTLFRLRRILKHSPHETTPQRPIYKILNTSFSLYKRNFLTSPYILF